MKASKAIAYLQEMMVEKGDLEVMFRCCEQGGRYGKCVLVYDDRVDNNGTPDQTFTLVGEHEAKEYD